MLKKIKNLVFDLDDTLYPQSLGICDSGWNMLAEVLSTDKKHEFGIVKATYEDFKIHKDAVLRAEKNMDWRAFQEYICHQDVSSIKYNHELKTYLSKLPHKKIIYTNAEDKHMDRVLKKLEICDVFEEKFTSYDGNHYFKPEVESFESFFKKTKIDPKESMMFEDSHKNLKKAKEYGMMTVLIDEFGEHGKPEYCDYVFKNINEALKIFL